MPIRVTFTGILDDFWGADEAFAERGIDGVRELMNEDLLEAISGLTLTVEQVEVKPSLDEMIEWARTRPPMTPAEEREQRRSFVYGNCKIENERITREMVEEADLRLFPLADDPSN